MSSPTGPPAPIPIPRPARAAADVPVVPWPAGLAARRRLTRLRRPCILLVASGHPPPLDLGPVEDWVREPADPEELALRRRTVHDRWAATRGGLWLDEDGLLHGDAGWVALSPAQAVVAEVLVAGAGRVVRRDEVRRAYEGAVGARSDIALSAVLARLRPKLAELGAVLHLLSGGRVLLEGPQFTDRSAVGNTAETMTRESVARSEL